MIGRFGSVNDIFLLKPLLYKSHPTKTNSPKVDLQHPGSYDERIFWSALQANNSPIVHYYLPLNVSQSALDCLLIAIQNNNLELVKIFCSKGANARVGNYLPLRIALEQNHINIAKFLLERFPLQNQILRSNKKEIID
jgi:hypothetical protein